MGPTGATGTSFNRVQVLGLIGFVVLVFLLLAWRSQQDGDKVRATQRQIVANEQQIRQSAYRSCLAGVEIIKTYDGYQDTLAAIERDDPVADPAIRARQIAAYVKYKIPMPECRKP